MSKYHVLHKVARTIRTVTEPSLDYTNKDWIMLGDLMYLENIREYVEDHKIIVSFLLWKWPNLHFPILV